MQGASLRAGPAQRLEQGEVVYLHCWGGRGRAGLMAACALVQLYNLSAEEVLFRIQAAFDTRQELGTQLRAASHPCSC